MAGEIEVIEISLLSGQSDRPALTFTPGTPANPVSVGTAGQWKVSGEGVGPVQLYLVFDGRVVHVAAAAPTAHVLLAGAVVGADWVKAPIPCELRFGGACLILRYVARADAASEEDRTVHDGGALWHAAQRVVSDAIEKARQGPPPEIGSRFPPARPAAGEPANFVRTVPLRDQLAVRDALAKALPPDEPTTIRDPAGGGPPVPTTLNLQDVTRVAPAPLMPRPLPPPPALAPPPAEPPPPREEAKPPATGASVLREQVRAQAEDYWRSASPVKRATLLLMPFALIASYFVLESEPAPQPVKAVPAAIASAKHPGATLDAGASAGGAAVTTGGDAAVDVSDGNGATSDRATGATPPPPAEGRPDAPKMPPLAHGQRTPERLALDAVAAGSFDEASKLYAALAAAHPEDPTYKEAARILREKTGQSR